MRPGRRDFNAAEQGHFGAAAGDRHGVERLAGYLPLAGDVDGLRHHTEFPGVAVGDLHRGLVQVTAFDIHRLGDVELHPIAAGEQVVAQ